MQKDPHYKAETRADGPLDSLSAPDADLGCAGRHCLVDFWGESLLHDAKQVERALRASAEAANAVVLHVHAHQFGGAGGVTGVALLAESHISVHTWPEYRYAAFDVFLCRETNPAAAVEVLRSIFKPEREQVREFRRGQITVCDSLPTKPSTD